MGRSKALALEDRIIIEKGITNNSSKRAIAETIGKDETIIGKEIKNHRFCVYHSQLKKCANYKKCPYKRECKNDCNKLGKF